MAKNRSIAIAALLATLFVVLAILSWGVVRKMQLDNGSQESAIALLERSFTNGTAEPLVAAAHPEWLQSMSASAIANYLQTSMEILGPLQAMTSITGTSTAGIVPVPGETVNANYVVNMEMGTTAFETTIDLRYSDGVWLVTNLVLNADALME